MRKVYCDLCGNEINKMTKKSCKHFDYVKEKHSAPMPETPLFMRIFFYWRDNFDLCEECITEAYVDLEKIKEKHKEDFENGKDDDKETN